MMTHAEDKSSNREGFDGHFRFGCSGKASLWRLHLSGENNEHNVPKKGARLCVPATGRQLENTGEEEERRCRQVGV